MDLGSSKDNFAEIKAQLIHTSTSSSIKSDDLLSRRDIDVIIASTVSSKLLWYLSFPCKEFYTINLWSRTDLDFWDLVTIFNRILKIASPCSTSSWSEISFNSIGHFKLKSIKTTSRSSHHFYDSPSRLSFFCFKIASTSTTKRSWFSNLKSGRVR